MAATQFLVLPETHSQPAAVPQAKPVVEAKPATPTTAVAKLVVILSGSAMIYCLISYGRIFQNYLQW